MTINKNQIVSFKYYKSKSKIIFRMSDRSKITKKFSCHNDAFNFIEKNFKDFLFLYNEE
jgi:hypothetical protein